MCGRFFVINSGLTRSMLEYWGLDPKQMRFSEDCAPGGQISIIQQDGAIRRIRDATWWLLLNQQTLKPDYKYASFNSRSDKLHITRSLAYVPYRESRCIIPASGFVEGFGDKKTYHQIELQEEAIAFGGIFKSWTSPEFNEPQYSASIITLPPHPKWQKIHTKAFPLMLPWKDKKMIDSWLDPHFMSVETFEPLLAPTVNVPQIITPIDRPARRSPLGLPYVIVEDEVRI